ncbi:hypothetical protein B0H11DRAFT_2295291 [Mycena galericulata]|nr:hypothetical protein B0H11DRAFT_2295291 [Mycena galericulata]
MLTSMLQSLFSCCIRSHRSADDDLTIIPDETTHLLPSSTGIPSPGLPDTIVVDQQNLNDRLGTIVRAKEGKMVNVGSRTPFTVVQVSTSPPTSSTAPPSPNVTAPPPNHPGSSNGASRRPPVHTMTPARGANRHLYTDSRYPSPNASRSSSRRRPEAGERERDRHTHSYADRYTYTSSAPHSETEGESEDRANLKGKQTASDWFPESESDASGAEVEVVDEVPPLTPGSVPIPTSTDTEEEGNLQSIAFSWGDK